MRASQSARDLDLQVRRRHNPYDCIRRPQQTNDYPRRLELNIRPQFDYTRPLIGRRRTIVRRDAADSETAALDERGESRGKAIVIASTPRAWLKVRVVENIQHLRLECKFDPLGNRNPFCQRQIVIPIVRAI